MFWAGLSGLRSLRAEGNALETLPWDSLATLPLLASVSADANRISALPPTFAASGAAAFAALTRLSLARNELACLPDSIGELAALEHLDVAANQIERVEAGVGKLVRLRHLDLSANRVRELPEAMAGLVLLTTLDLNGNRLKTVPGRLLGECTSLRTLRLHGNPITQEELKQLPGFAVFEANRKAKYDKKLEANLMGREGFDEGADSDVHRCERARESER